MTERHHPSPPRPAAAGPSGARRPSVGAAVLLGWCLCGVGAGSTAPPRPARATPAPPVSSPAAPTAPAVPTSAEVERLLLARRFAEAHEAIARRIEAGDRDPLLRYNDACALAQLGRLDEAESRLMDSVKAGFRDFDAMEEDPDLEPIRASRTYEAIMEARERLERAADERRADERRADERAADGRDAADRTRPGPSRRRARPDPLAAWRERHGDAYRYDEDAARGLAFATFLDEDSHARMKADLARLAAHLEDAYFGAPPDEVVLVAILRPKDAGEYLAGRDVKGMYQHESRRLVARDTGQSLQHEFVHLMHFARMERLGQRHPIWIQEGLAALYEDFTLHADGRVEFHPNIRFNIARRQVVSGTAMPWRELVGLSADEFMREPTRNYPLVRSIFEFLAREGRLEAFYRALEATWRDDQDGSSAIERAFGEPLARVEDRWKRWMTERGAIDDSIDRGDASLGIAADDAGNGVRIRSFVLRSAARAAGLRVGDVVVEVGGRPVRNREELVLAVARLEAGEPVAVAYLRDGVRSVAEVRPRRLGD